MIIDDERAWLTCNGVLELCNPINTPVGTTAVWVGLGGMMLTTCSVDPVNDLYSRIKQMLWWEIDTAYLDE